MDPYHEVYVEDLRNLALEIAATGHLPLLTIYPALYYDGIAADEITAYEPMLWAGERFSPDMLTELHRKHEAIRTVAATTAAPSVDLQGLFRKFTGRERAGLFLDEMHPSIPGHQQIGEMIGAVTAELISETGLHAKRSARSGPDSGT